MSKEEFENLDGITLCRTLIWGVLSAFFVIGLPIVLAALLMSAE